MNCRSDRQSGARKGPLDLALQRPAYRSSYDRRRFDPVVAGNGDRLLFSGAACLADRPDDRLESRVTDAWRVASRAATKCTGSHLLLCGRRLPQLNLIPIQVIDPGKATVGFIHSFGVDLDSLLL